MGIAVSKIRILDGVQLRISRLETWRCMAKLNHIYHA
jgi:hypothetical protein